MFKTSGILLFWRMIAKEEVEDLFNRYASTMNNALFGDVIDVSTFMHAFAAYVVGANPNGVLGGKNDDEFARSIKSGIDFYRRIGVNSMNILRRDVTILDDYHAMAKIQWQCMYCLQDRSGEIEFDVFYFVQEMDHAVKIFAFVTGDEQKALIDHGLINSNGSAIRQDTITR
jgi:hypothetical protein